jgi:hypothetical protein
MNEHERRTNDALRALDEAHRSGRISREEYRARRRAMLSSYCDSDGVTARKALAPAASEPPPRGSSGMQRVAGVPADMATALFPDRRRLTLKVWLIAVAGLGLGMLLLYAALQIGAG